MGKENDSGGEEETKETTFRETESAFIFILTSFLNSQGAASSLSFFFFFKKGIFWCFPSLFSSGETKQALDFDGGKIGRQRQQRHENKMGGTCGKERGSRRALFLSPPLLLIYQAMCSTTTEGGLPSDPLLQEIGTKQHNTVSPSSLDCQKSRLLPPYPPSENEAGKHFPPPPEEGSSRLVYSSRVVERTVLFHQRLLNQCLLFSSTPFFSSSFFPPPRLFRLPAFFYLASGGEGGDALSSEEEEK